MAEILGIQTVGVINVITTDTNPTLTGGADATIGTIAMTADNTGIFVKFGALTTDWTNLSGLTTSTQSITGLTQIDMTGLTGNVVLTLTSANVTETINKVVNATGINKIIIYLTSPLAVTFNDLSIGGVGANIHLFAPTLIADGVLSGFLELTFRNNAWYQTNFINTYNS